MARLRTGSHRPALVTLLEAVKENLTQQKKRIGQGDREPRETVAHFQSQIEGLQQDQLLHKTIAGCPSGADFVVAAVVTCVRSLNENNVTLLGAAFGSHRFSQQAGATLAGRLSSCLACSRPRSPLRSFFACVSAGACLATTPERCHL